LLFPPQPAHVESHVLGGHCIAPDITRLLVIGMRGWMSRLQVRKWLLLFAIERIVILGVEFDREGLSKAA
jgi:hypothetical protein